MSPNPGRKSIQTARGRQGSAFAGWGDTRCFLDEREISISSWNFLSQDVAYSLGCNLKGQKFSIGIFLGALSLLADARRPPRRMNNSVPDSVVSDTVNQDEPVISSAPL